MPSAILLVLALAATSSPSEAPSPGAKSEYHDGFRQGCARALIGQASSSQQAGTTTSYRDGWDAGYESCRAHGQMQNMGRPAGPDAHDMF